MNILIKFLLAHACVNSNSLGEKGERTDWRDVTDVKTLIAPPLANGTASGKLILFVHSHPSHVALRSVIRRTWGSVVPYRVFVTGLTKDERDYELLLSEALRFKDVLTFDFLEDYGNLTLKHLSTYRWLHDNFKENEAYVLKTDDDVFVETLDLLRHLEHVRLPPNGTFIYGYVHEGAKVMKDPESKWYIEGFPRDHYPPYVSGSAYVTTLQTVAKILRVFRRSEKMIFVDDAVVTGILAGRVPPFGVPLYDWKWGFLVNNAADTDDYLSPHIGLISPLLKVAFDLEEISIRVLYAKAQHCMDYVSPQGINCMNTMYTIPKIRDMKIPVIPTQRVFLDESLL